MAKFVEENKITASEEIFRERAVMTFYLNLRNLMEKFETLNRFQTNVFYDRHSVEIYKINKMMCDLASKFD